MPGSFDLVLPACGDTSPDRLFIHELGTLRWLDAQPVARSERAGRFSTVGVGYPRLEPESGWMPLGDRVFSVGYSVDGDAAALGIASVGLDGSDQRLLARAPSLGTKSPQGGVRRGEQWVRGVGIRRGKIVTIVEDVAAGMDWIGEIRLTK